MSDENLRDRGFDTRCLHVGQGARLGVGTLADVETARAEATVPRILAAHVSYAYILSFL